MEKEILNKEQQVGTTHEMSLEDIVGEKELPSIQQLSNATGLHCNSILATKGEIGVPVGVKLTKLQICGEDVTPFMPINELDCMVVGFLAFYPHVTQKMIEAKKALEDKQVVNE